jgi:protein SCO1/2
VPRSGALEHLDRRSTLPRIAYGLGAALTALVLWFAIARPVQVLPRIRTAPEYTLIDQDGRWFGSADTRGQTALVSFGYSRCGESCTPGERGMRAVAERLRADGALAGRVRLVTISVDPERDQPADLRAYAGRLGASPREWTLLTGPAGDVKTLVGGGLGVYYGPWGSRVAFDQRALLIDGGGEVRAEYDATALDPAIVSRDVALIAREAASTSLERPIYEAAHIFVCYPR